MISDIVVNGNSGGVGRTELDSHDKMCVLGKHCYILSESGKNIDVAAFA